MRYFDTTLFCGAGKFSEADCRLLRKQLEDALSALSGIQQGGEDAARREGWDTREDAVRDIAAALLGKSVTIGDDLPYPGKLDGPRAAESGRRIREVHQRWRDAHERIMRRLSLPCGLELTPDVKIGQHWTEAHEVDHEAKCVIRVNDSLDFDTPEHLILHEAAHHVSRGRDDCYDSEEALTCAFGHCKHWARTLCDLYERAHVELPQGTKFEAFAKEAGILHREYLPPEKRMA